MNDPERLSHELLSAAREDLLDDAAAERVRQGLVAGGALAATTVGTKSLLGTSLKWWLFGVTAVGVAGGVLYAATQRHAAAIDHAVVETREVERPVAPVQITTTPSAVSIEDLPRVVEPETATVSATVRVEAPPAAASSSPTPAQPLAREGLLLLQARGLLESNPGGALDLIRQHEHEFPTSQLAPEREKLKAEALRRLQNR